VPLDQPAPHSVNLFLMNLKDLGEQLQRGFPALQTSGRINIALPFWELTRLPPTWVEILDTLDLVIAASDFVKDALAAEANCPPIVSMGHPLYLPRAIAPDRQRFGIPEDCVAFLASFDVSSDMARKNPVAAITAFAKAFGDDGRACLVLKVNSHQQLDPVEGERLGQLRRIAERSANVRVIHEVLGYRDLMALYASCDVFVSLHRAEGLGLCLMEMMTLGKPVIATCWSGNMSFTNARNSCLVGYDFIPVRGENQIAYAPSNLGPGAVWADARVDEAAHWMRRLADEPQLRERIARTARSDMAEYQRRIQIRELTDAVRRIATRRGVALV
jgi:glycosyltransferase involved in cell wall biosynthesis